MFLLRKHPDQSARLQKQGQSIRQVWLEEEVI
jgi:hypothetical protein